MSTKMYPEGKTSYYTKWVNGVLKFFKRSNATEFASFDGNVGLAYEAGKTYTARVRATAAEIKAGKDLVAAIPGYKTRIIDATMIAYGGAATTATSVDLLGTRGGSAVRPMVTGVAALTQSAKVSIGEAPAAGATAILADGASFTALDANTALRVTQQSGGSDLAGCTGVDVCVVYELIRA
jgi:hypothetical protein